MDDVFEVYRYNGRDFPSVGDSTRDMIIPLCEPTMFSNSVEDISNIEIRNIRMQRYKCSMHLTYEYLSSRFGMDSNLIENSNEEFLYTVFKQVCEATNHNLEREQPVHEGHPVFLNSCRLIKQGYASLLLVDLDFWGVSMRDVDSIGKRAFEEMFYGYGSRSTRIEGNSNYLRNSNLRDWELSENDFSMEAYSYGTFPKVEYNDDAEEIAHELLKGMVSKIDFENYKLEGYIIIKGTYGRTYKVKKNEMMDVHQEFKGKTKDYRLCIEPKHRSKICPTDEVIAKIKLIRASEKTLHELANRFNSYTGDYYQLGNHNH